MAGTGIPGQVTPDDSDWIVRRFEALEAAVRELGPSVAASVSEIVARLVNFESGFGQVTGAVPPTSWGEACSTTIAVPSWASAAAVVATGYTLGLSTASGGQLFSALHIDGEASPYAEVLTFGASQEKFTPLSFSVVLDDPGDEITVSVLWYTSPTFTGGAAKVSAIAMFSK